MSTRNRFAFVSVIAGLILLPATMDATRPVYRADIGAIGMGGAYTAHTRGISSLYYNPAALAVSGFDLDLVNVRVGFNREMQNVLKFVDDNRDNFESFDSLAPGDADQFLEDMNSFDDRYISLRVEPSFALVFKNFGISTYLDFKPSFRLDKGIYVPRIYLRGHMDWVTAVGYGRGFRVSGLDEMVNAGIALKFIQRREINDFKVTASDMSESGEMAQTLEDTLQNVDKGVAVDLGALLTPAPNLNVGVAIQNIGSVGDESLPVFLNAGVAYHLESNFEYRFVKSLVLTGDLRDVLNSQDQSFFSHIHLGAEIRIPFLSLRAGIGQGYLSTGVSLTLGALQLDYAYFGEELGAAPGWNPEFQHLYQFRIRI